MVNVGGMTGPSAAGFGVDEVAGVGSKISWGLFATNVRPLKSVEETPPKNMFPGIEVGNTSSGKSFGIQGGVT
jgi:hypothetical protein